MSETQELEEIVPFVFRCILYYK